jgi:dephospho-CoA kinase
MKVKIGITGGIGSGKSLISQFFEVIGIPVFIADAEAKRITAESEVVKAQLTELFGSKLFPDGILDKKLFASIIFNDKTALLRANAVIHPEVRKDFRQWVETQQSPVVAIEAAILFEGGFSNETDQIINVTAPSDLRLERVMKRDHVSEEKVLERINNQLSDEERNKRSDYIIVNDDVTPVIPQILKILSRIQSSSKNS